MGDVDRGACGECELFGNDPRLLGDVEAMGILGMVVRGCGDENDPAATGFCPHADRDGLRMVAEDTPACAWKVEAE